MPETKIKICGLSRLQDIEYVNEAMPDFIGFVFAESRRQISAESAYRLKNCLDYRIRSVGVFVNEGIDTIKFLCQLGVIDYIQLHGDENAGYIAALKRETGKPVIKAIRVKDAHSIRLAEQLPCDFLLLDTYSDKEYGGTGRTFDWNFARNIGKPFFLAGGISSGNARAAIDSMHPFCLDVSSGAETNGLKDRDKIMQLIKLVRSVK